MLSPAPHVHESWLPFVGDLVQTSDVTETVQPPGVIVAKAKARATVGKGQHPTIEPDRNQSKKHNEHDTKQTLTRATDD